MVGQCFSICMVLDNCNSYSIRFIDGGLICHVSEEGPLHTPPEEVEYGVYFFKKGSFRCCFKSLLFCFFE